MLEVDREACSDPCARSAAGQGADDWEPAPQESAAQRPLRVMFLHTWAGVGGAETLMLNLIRRLDRRRFAPELACLKTLGAIGQTLSAEIPTYERLLSHKFDLRVLPRLTRLLRQRQIDAIVSVGAGDKAFWGRLAARLAGVPVALMAIHSTGWPDEIGRLNRALTRLTDGFIAVAQSHGRYLTDVERLPAAKVFVIPNGIDTRQFCPRPKCDDARGRLGLSPGPLVGTVARLTEAKNLELFLEVAARTRRGRADAQFVIVGDGPLGDALRRKAQELGLAQAVHFLGWRSDIAEIVALLDVFLLTSRMEANPVSVLEALGCGVPVISTRVGSVAETVVEGVGYLVEPGDAAGMTARLGELLDHPQQARQMGAVGRRLVEDHWSLDGMVEKYQELIERLYRQKRPAGGGTP